MAKQPKYNWDTQFETAQNTMTHTMTDRVQVVSNIKNGEILVKVDGNTVNAYYNTPVKEYEALLLSVEEYAYQLQREDKFKMAVCKIAVYVLMCIAILALFALAGDNDSWSLGQFFGQKACCMGIMAGCYYSVKRTPMLAAAWQEMNRNNPE